AVRVRQSFHGRDRRPGGLAAEHQAGGDAPAVDDHRACPALAYQTAFLRPGETEILTQHVEQRVMGEDVGRPIATVDGELDRSAIGERAIGDGAFGHQALAASRSIAVAMPRSPMTRSIARRYSGLARIDVGDGLASANSTSRRRSFASSDACGSASNPASSTTTTGRGPTLPSDIPVT